MIEKEVVSKLSFLTSEKFSTILLQESQKPESEQAFKPFTDSFPAELAAVASNYSDNEIALMSGSPLQNEVFVTRDAIKKDYDGICASVEEFKQYSFEEYKRNLLVAQTRALQFQVGEEVNQALVPIADMVNHSATPCVTYMYSKDHDGFQLVAT